MKRQPESKRREFLVSSGLGVVALMGGSAVSAVAAEQKMNEQEKQAAKVVNDFIAAWITRDPEKIGSYMADDCTMKGSETAPWTTGRANFVQNVGRFLGRDSTKQITFTPKASEIYAVSGETGVAVLTKRVDIRTADGKKTELPIAAFFWVKNGKIQEWQDLPLHPPEPLPGAAR